MKRTAKPFSYHEVTMQLFSHEMYTSQRNQLLTLTSAKDQHKRWAESFQEILKRSQPTIAARLDEDEPLSRWESIM